MDFRCVCKCRAANGALLLSLLGLCSRAGQLPPIPTLVVDQARQIHLLNPSRCLQLFSSEENQHKVVEEDTISTPPHNLSQLEIMHLMTSSYKVTSTYYQVIKK